MLGSHFRHSVPLCSVSAVHVQIANERLNPRRQWQQRQQHLGANARLYLKSAEQLQRRHTSGYPGNVHLSPSGNEQPLVVVAPSYCRDGCGAARYVSLVQTSPRFGIKLDQIVITAGRSQILQLAISALAVTSSQSSGYSKQLTGVAPLHDHAKGAVKASVDMCG